MSDGQRLERKWREFCIIGNKDPDDPKLALPHMAFFAGAAAMALVMREGQDDLEQTIEDLDVEVAKIFAKWSEGAAH